MMNIPRPGQTFRNYRALCEYLAEDVKDGSGKIAQLRVWRQFFNWNRNGHAWIIIPFTTEEDMPRSAGRWKKYMDPNILCMLYEAMSGRGVNVASMAFRELFLYNTEAFYHLGLCNHRWKDLASGDENEQQVYNQSYPRLHKIFNDSLRRLHTMRVIYTIRTYLVKGPERLFLVEESDRIRIEHLKGDLFRAMGVKHEAEVFQKNKKEEFYNTLRILVKASLGFEAFYSIHRITFTEDSLNELQNVVTLMRDRDQRLNRVNRESLKMHLNIFPTPPLSDIVNLVIPQMEV